MSRATAILLTLIAYKLVLVGIGLVGNKMSRDDTDYFLGGRKLGPAVAALSASASSSSVWTLLGVTGYAYTYGLAAIWIFPACVGGFALNWFVLAPALRTRSEAVGAITVTEMLAGPVGTKGRATINRVASAIVLLCLLTYVAAQFQGAGKAFEETFGLGFVESVVLGAAIVVFYTLLGGFWAVSLTDTLQGVMMAVAAIALPIAALLAVGGPSGLLVGIEHTPLPTGWTSVLKGLGPASGVGFVLGLLGIGLGYPGQPHVVNRLMALRDHAALRNGRRIALAWACIMYAGTITLGLCGRLLLPDLTDGEDLFVAATAELFPPVVAGVMIAAVLSAIMSTADSQLLVAASAVSHDLRPSDHEGLGSARPPSLVRSRIVVFVLAVAATGLALRASEAIFSSVLFAWSAMGAAFGPVLLVTVLRQRPPWAFVLASMVAGFALSVSAYSIPSTKGGVFERVLPFVVALGIAAWGHARRRANT